MGVEIPTRHDDVRLLGSVVQREPPRPVARRQHAIPVMIAGRGGAERQHVEQPVAGGGSLAARLFSGQGRGQCAHALDRHDVRNRSGIRYDTVSPATSKPPNRAPNGPPGRQVDLTASIGGDSRIRSYFFLHPTEQVHRDTGSDGPAAAGSAEPSAPAIPAAPSREDSPPFRSAFVERRVGGICIFRR